MADTDLIEQWLKVSDAKEALRQIVEHEYFLGYDPYFAKLRAALLEMADRCSK